MTLSDPSRIPWNFDQFCAAMRAAGWNRDLTAGYFIHKETGAIFEPFNFTDWRHRKYGNGEAWWQFAMRNETPTEAPF